LARRVHDAAGEGRQGVEAGVAGGLPAVELLDGLLGQPHHLAEHAVGGAAVVAAVVMADGQGEGLLLLRGEAALLEEGGQVLVGLQGDRGVGQLAVEIRDEAHLLLGVLEDGLGRLGRFGRFEGF